MIEHRGRISLAAILDTSRVTRPLAKQKGLFDHIFSILQPQFTLSNCMIIGYPKNKNEAKVNFLFFFTNLSLSALEITSLTRLLDQKVSY